MVIPKISSILQLPYCLMQIFIIYIYFALPNEYFREVTTFKRILYI